MKFLVTHKTLYEYDEMVSVSHHSARVEPKITATQECDEFMIHIAPEPTLRKMRTDYFGNGVCSFSIQEIHRRLEITATSIVSVTAVTPPALSLSPNWEKLVRTFRDPVSPEAVEPYEFCFDSPLLRTSEELAEYARQSFPTDTPLLVGVNDLNRRIFKDFKYDPVATTVATPLEEVLEKRRGVCQDFAHLAIASLRSLGLSARYVSGYLRTRPPEGKKRMIGADASHAWFSVFCPDLGWVDFDPTNNLLPAEEHIVLAYGRDYSDVCPVGGIIVGGGDHEVRVGVDVEEITESDERGHPEPE